MSRMGHSAAHGRWIPTSLEAFGPASWIEYIARRRSRMQIETWFQELPQSAVLGNILCSKDAKNYSQRSISVHAVGCSLGGTTTVNRRTLTIVNPENGYSMRVRVVRSGIGMQPPHIILAHQTVPWVFYGIS